MQPLSSMRATIVGAENQNGATIVKATFFFWHYYIIWESNNAGKAILKWKSKIQRNPRRIVRLYEWYKAKTICCACFAAAMLMMVAAATIVRFPPVNFLVQNLSTSIITPKLLSLPVKHWYSTWKNGMPSMPHSSSLLWWTTSTLHCWRPLQSERSVYWWAQSKGWYEQRWLRLRPVSVVRT